MGAAQKALCKASVVKMTKVIKPNEIISFAFLLDLNAIAMEEAPHMHFNKVNSQISFFLFFLIRLASTGLSEYTFFPFRA